eukprot:284815682_3
MVNCNESWRICMECREINRRIKSVHCTLHEITTTAQRFHMVLPDVLDCCDCLQYLAEVECTFDFHSSAMEVTPRQHFNIMESFERADLEDIEEVKHSITSMASTAASSTIFASQYSPVLTEENLPQALLKMEVRKLFILLLVSTQSAAQSGLELRNGNYRLLPQVSKIPAHTLAHPSEVRKFTQLIPANIGNPQAVGQCPTTFNRQVRCFQADTCCRSYHVSSIPRCGAPLRRKYSQSTCHGPENICPLFHLWVPTLTRKVCRFSE